MNATATVVYYNAGKGSWSIAYNGETKGTFTKTSTDSWIKATKIPLGVCFRNGKITLFSPDQKDCIFSLLEVLHVQVQDGKSNKRKNKWKIIFTIYF